MLHFQQYLGNWYQYEGLPAFFAPSGTSCIRATYGDRGDGTVSVRNVDVSPSGKYEQICGYAEIPDPSHPGELKVCLNFLFTFCLVLIFLLLSKGLFSKCSCWRLLDTWNRL